MSALPPSNVAVLGAVVLVCLGGCVSPRSPRQDDLPREIAAADAAYRSLQPGRIAAYNAALASIARHMERDTPADFQRQLAAARVSLDGPAINLPLVHYHIVRKNRMPNDPNVGIPILLDYDTKHARLYPPEGMLLSATAIFRRKNGEPHISLVTGQSNIELNGSDYPLAVDNVAPGLTLARRARHLERTGFRSMIRPAEMERKPQIYLIDPYDPNKIPILMVHGLQSTPVSFIQLVNAMHSDPAITKHFQIWHFHYATGTPVLVNALTLRQELAKIIHAVDRQDRDFATHHIVVLGHSMGGVISHTLASSSGNNIWGSVFVVPPHQLRGNKEIISELKDVMFFRRNQRIARLIFMATPHRGSMIADTLAAAIAKSLIRLPPTLQTGLVDIEKENLESMTPEGAAFFKQLNFSSVHTLSPHSPTLLALARLPIAVPFHSIIAQHRPGPAEAGSDGVVAYASSHLDGAASELIVKSGHKVVANPDAQREVIRILRLELQSAKTLSTWQKSISSVRQRNRDGSFTRRSSPPSAGLPAKTLPQREQR